MIRVNFSDVGKFELLDAGVYPVQVLEQEVLDSENSEYPYVKWSLEVFEGPHQGSKLWTNGSLNPKAAFFLQRDLIALGADPATLEGEVDLDFEAFVGAKCKAAVIQEPYRGRMGNTIVELFPLESNPESVTPPPTSPSTNETGKKASSKVGVAQPSGVKFK